MDIKFENGAEGSQPLPEFLWEVHSYINEYIRFADVKAAFVVVIATGLLGALVTSSLYRPLFQSSAEGPARSVWIAVGAIILLGASLICSIIAVKPRLTGKWHHGFIFWESIAGFESGGKYWHEVKSLSTEDRARAIAEHLYALSGVARAKYKWVNLAILSLICGAIPAAILLFVEHALKTV